MERLAPVALITCCSSGIGKHLALASAAKGVSVLATARRAESLVDLTSRNSRIEAYSLDLSDRASMETLRDEVEYRTGGRLDFLVNNAGAHYAATAMDLDVEEVAKLFQVNCFTVMRMCQLFVPLLLVWQSAYNASKAALSQYSKTLRVELEPFGIEVIEIVTGFVQSNILHHGLYVPEGSLYLPIKDTVECIKYRGNAGGMATDAYARTVVDKLLNGRTGVEMWEGGLALYLRVLVAVCPVWLLNSIIAYRFNLGLLKGLS
ncbi:1-acyl dihydroxyacetone phosphate reductase [Lojkania enalia]|uniref:1-acyl dihydroxyacetone phosphate reductase n=1 Tax=Lojkania enalia TaxID=147567 RepID=A0A9P4NAV4_9PLEO|nr:1-acyl dihydroxyacetone phosphate reductase [Didymosphaeria enalia]